GAPVLLIDELDRSDEAFEAFLLEVLADFQVTIPELGTVKAEHPPNVVITSNRTREIHDALKRRCLYHWVGYPSATRELEIVRAKVPGVGKKLSEQVVGFVQALRKQDLFKSPGVAETLDWATAMSELDAVALDRGTVSDTLGVLLKYQDDIARLEGGKVKELLDQVQAELRAAEAERHEPNQRPRRPARREHPLFRACVARRRHSSGAGLGARRAFSGARRRLRRQGGLLLDIACGVRQAPRTFGAVRPGVPDFLSQARLSGAAHCHD